MTDSFCGLMNSGERVRHEGEFDPFNRNVKFTQTQTGNEKPVYHEIKPERGLLCETTIRSRSTFTQT